MNAYLFATIFILSGLVLISIEILILKIIKKNRDTKNNQQYRGYNSQWSQRPLIVLSKNSHATGSNNPDGGNYFTSSFIFHVFKSVLYIISAILLFIFLLFKLKTKRVPKIFPKTFNQFNERGNNTNQHTYTGWPTQYIQYVISDFRSFVWGYRTKDCKLKRLAYSENTSRNYQSDEDVINLTKIPFYKKFLNSIHSGSIINGKATKSKQNRYWNGWSTSQAYKQEIPSMISAAVPGR